MTVLRSCNIENACNADIKVLTRKAVGTAEGEDDMQEPNLIDGLTLTSLSLWADAMFGVFGAIDLQAPKSSTVSGGLDCVQIGGLGVSILSATAVQMERKTKLAATCRQRRYVFQIQLQGQSSFVFDSQTKALSAGEGILCDTARPFTQVFGEDSLILCLSGECNEIKGQIRSRAILWCRFERDLGQELAEVAVELCLGH
jgi:AraC-binding-like domain